MFTFLTKWFKSTPQFLGVLPDNRTDTEKESDAHFHEIVAAAQAVNWQEKAKEKWRTFPDFDQFNSFMCMAFSMKKLMGVYFWLKYGTFLEFSEEDIYQRRKGKPDWGMEINDLYSIIGDEVTLKQLTNAVIKSDSDADNAKIEPWMRDVGSSFKMGRKITLASDIDAIATVIQATGKAIHLVTFFTSQEWSQLVPTIQDNGLTYNTPNVIRHAVTAVDYFNYLGKRYILIEDSAHFGGLTRRLLTVDWISKRIQCATYPMNFKFDTSADPLKPKYQFTRDINFSPLYFTDKDVVVLQDILKYEGLFPANISSTGYFGAVTRDSVKAFQAKYSLPITGNLDSATRGKINNLYN